ncbi:hypothetical protein RJT34_16474 [Clitoria ternatea]|uniref:CUE domain-containing protein n=1 Tax=Clitoria ternatea TaxID=43366 RepID=A0AAN9JAA7_CLITE
MLTSSFSFYVWERKGKVKKKKDCAFIFYSMKPQSSSLNPYAASYIPLCIRDGGSKSYDGTVWFQDPQHVPGDQQQCVHSNTERTSKPETVPANRKPTCSSYHDQSPEVIEFDEQFDMDVEYLRMQFPDLSVESLEEVYTLNHHELEGAVDMLHQLVWTEDLETTPGGLPTPVRLPTPGGLPETLDIGDVSESGLSGGAAPSKQKTVAAETSTPSSSSHVASANVS